VKTLTLSQRWATLVALGAKRIETRSWRTSYRGPLAIHAATSVEGSLHSAAEYTTLEDAARGTTVLAMALYQLAY